MLFRSTTGTAVGSLKNVGYVEMAQSVAITQATTSTAYASAIVLPANSQVLSIDVFATVAWDGTSSNLSVGTSATATELVAATAISAIGRTALTPGTDATRTGVWIDVGANDVQVYFKSTNTGAGVGVATVRYLQAINLTA